jgi:hypothetical protein
MTWGYVAVAAATVVSGAIASDSSRKAANTQADAAKQAAATQAQGQKDALTFVQKQEQPFQEAGVQALGQYQNLMNGGAPNFDLTKMPGYQFSLDQGTKAIENSAAARGTSFSGNTLRDLQSFGQGQASLQFNDYMTRLAGLANMGQSAASGVANQGANLLAGQGNSLAQGIMGAGNAQAAGTIGQANAINSTIGGLTPLIGGLFKPGTGSVTPNAYGGQTGLASTDQYINSGSIG